MSVKKSDLMPKAIESPQPPTADEIAELADKGEDISRFFTHDGKMMPPIALDTKEDGDRSSMQFRMNKTV
jgi:hypothetical protein